MNRIGWTLLAAVAVIPVLADPAAGAALGQWTARQPFEGTTGDTIHYYLFTPAGVETAKRYPLVLWLHGGLKSNGVGGPNMPADAFYRDEHQRQHPCFVLRPVAVKGANWVSPRGAGTASHALPADPAPSMTVLGELLDRVIKQNPIDPAGLHVVGASMGGYGVWDLIARHPKRFASAVPICGGGDPSQAARLKDARIWIFHSTDDRIVPPRGSRDMFQALAKARGQEPAVRKDDAKTIRSCAGGAIRYTEFARGGHNAWDPALRDPEVFGWVFQGAAGRQAGARGETADKGFRTLFDGKTLKGWTLRGGTATYVVEDGTIVGTTVEGSPNTFLCTEKEYGDFELVLDVRCDPKLNSGIQIRSHVYQKATPMAGRPKRIRKAGDVYGYQCEIAGGGSAGNFWDEARRARWLADTSKKPTAREAYKPGQWNTYRIVAQGDRIRSWVNGVPCADFRDSTDAKGFIGLQVHGIRKGTGPYQVRWRNIRIREL